MENVMIVIPSLNPDKLLIEVIDSVTKAGCFNVLLVDDGSDDLHKEPFEYAKEKGLIVLRHDVNRGKGYALRTAFKYIRDNKPGMAAVTVDGDNQHKIEDIKSCVEKLKENPDDIILGCRDFSSSEIPFRSRFGNNITKSIFRLFCGIKLSDTQTGLRVIPYKHLDSMLKVKGDRYEYETNMLLYMKAHKINFTEVKIKTVYIDNNSSSHFNPIKDSFRIYKEIFKFAINSMLSAVIDLSVFFLICMLLKNAVKKSVYVLMATIIARAVSSLCNFAINHKYVFETERQMKHTIVRYYLLCFCQMLVSYGFVLLLSTILNVSGGVITVVKFVVDTMLFFVSFRIQKNWVYKD